MSELILFNASRSQLVTDVIQPELAKGKIVLCDRFSDSTVAYQSYGRGLDLNTVKELNLIASRGLKPDLTFLLDVSPEVGLARKKERANDRFEQESVGFHRKVRQGFLALAASEPRRWIVIDAALPKDQIARAIWEKMGRLLRQS